MISFIITHVHYDKNHHHIEKVKGFIQGLPDKVNFEHTHFEIFAFLGGNFIYRTSKVDKNGYEVEGPKVECVQLGNKYYLRTVPDDSEEDNLGDLPEY